MTKISWYGKKSAYNKLRFRICQFIVIVASAVIPIINLGIPIIFGTNNQIAPYQALGITAILGGVITIVTALSQMDAYFETWVLYRTTGETLKRERFLFINSAADYSSFSGEAKNKLLVERVEECFQAKFKVVIIRQQAKQQSEQQLNELIQRQREINKQQREELLELREFREKYENQNRVKKVIEEVELMRTRLDGEKYPTNKTKYPGLF